MSRRFLLATAVAALALSITPLHALAHFVKELRACPGAADLKAGDIVTTGTWTDAWPVASGQVWTARFSNPLEPLKVRFI